MLWLLVTANVVHSPLIFFTPMMEALGSFETLVLAKATSHETAFFFLALSIIKEELRCLVSGIPFKCCSDHRF
jgi:hypothetical protein